MGFHQNLRCKIIENCKVNNIRQEMQKTENKNSRANWVFFTDKGRLTNSFSNHFKKASKLRAINRGWKMSLFYGLFLCLTVPNVSKWIVRLQPSSRICGFMWSGSMLVISFTSFNVFNLFKSSFGLKERSVLRYSCDIFLSPNGKDKIRCQRGIHFSILFQIT